jgi:hypothetical protein
MATATSERRAATAAGVLAAVAVALAVTGCSGGGSYDRGALDGIRPGPAPSRWHVATLPNGTARLAYPAGWHAAAQTDPGTITFVRTARHGRIDGYLNVTPRQGAETLANWARFRPAHNLEEGDRSVAGNGAATRVPFNGGRGSCVDDTYRTSVTTYRELACLVAGRHASTVIVAAAPQARWRAERPALVGALDAYAVR